MRSKLKLIKILLDLYGLFAAYTFVTLKKPMKLTCWMLITTLISESAIAFQKILTNSHCKATSSCQWVVQLTAVILYHRWPKEQATRENTRLNSGRVFFFFFFFYGAQKWLLILRRMYASFKIEQCYCLANYWRPFSLPGLLDTPDDPPVPSGDDPWS